MLKLKPGIEQRLKSRFFKLNYCQENKKSYFIHVICVSQNVHVWLNLIYTDFLVCDQVSGSGHLFPMRAVRDKVNTHRPKGFLSLNPPAMGQKICLNIKISVGFFFFADQNKRKH